MKESLKPVIDLVLGIIFSNLLANTVRFIISIIQKLLDTQALMLAVSQHCKLVQLARYNFINFIYSRSLL